MTSAFTGAAGALPTVSSAREPAFVREGSSQVKQAYQEGLGFEEMLVEQLAQSMTESTEGAGGEAGEETGEPASAGGGGQGALTSALLPRALADGVVSGGGFGLASQLTHELDPSATSTPRAAGAAGASAGGASAAGTGS